MANIDFKIGLDVITSYKRLSYTPWHAIAEFVDNSTQSYFDNKDVLDRAYVNEDLPGLEVAIVYDRDLEGGFLRIVDNAMGMSLTELNRAMHVALRPSNPTGRSRYGMGLKTSACWIGNHWTVRTKKLGETVEHTVTVDVPKIAAGDGDLPYQSKGNMSADEHYTIVEITGHNRQFYGRTLGKIREFLSSMYRVDFRNGDLRLYWQDELLTWKEPEMLQASDGSYYRKEFQYTVGGNVVSGWVGILARGTRANAGFSILHSGRVIRGWPDSWRPSSLYGQMQGSNDLVNQRLVGEVHLDDFEVSHTKDDILWLGSQEEDVEEGLKKHCADYRETARKPWKDQEADERGPSEIELEVAVDEIKRELESAEMVDKIRIDLVPPEEIIAKTKEKIVGNVTTMREETFRAIVADLTVKVFLAPLSFSEPYVIPESTKDSEVLVIVNTGHPHWNELKGSEGAANYLRHCVYDAIAEWKARKKAARIDPDTIKLLKDQLLRVSFEIEQHQAEPDAEVV